MYLHFRRNNFREKYDEVETFHPSLEKYYIKNDAKEANILVKTLGDYSIH